jgi:hypothetical protein
MKTRFAHVRLRLSRLERVKIECKPPCAANVPKGASARCHDQHGLALVGGKVV